MRGRMRGEFLSFLDKQGEVTKLAVFHYEVDVAGRFETVMEGNDMWVA